MNPKFLFTLIGALLLVTIGGIFALKKLGPQDEPATAAAGAAQSVTTMSSDPTLPVKDQAPTDTVTNAPKPEMAQPEVSEQDREIWDNQIADLLTDTTIENREAGQKLAAIAANNSAPEEVRIDAIQHALNLIGDEEYLEDMMALAARTDIPEEMQEIIFSDIHNRPEEISVPVAKEIARQKDHPLAQEAQDFVDFFTDDPLTEVGSPEAGK
ncbi:MAG: hypothetical protein KDN19_10300 [Verrucomicrobiae bacterium]|nr:hypothetical protein [Verrucomicrobiae bacterium]